MHLDIVVKDVDSKMFVIYVTIGNQEKMPIYLNKQTLI